jgi:hypothetical protein
MTLRKPPVKPKQDEFGGQILFPACRGEISPAFDVDWLSSDI